MRSAPAADPSSARSAAPEPITDKTTDHAHTTPAQRALPTMSATIAPITGSALITHHAEHSDATRADAVTRAGYLRPDGHPSFTAYYEALLVANDLGSPAAWLAAARPEAWHGPSHTNAAPERFALLTITDANGQPIGATLPVAIDRHGWSDEDTYASAESLITDHADHYANAAQGPDQFPLLVTLRDRSGLVELFTIDADGSHADALGDGLSRCERCGCIHDTDDGETVNDADGDPAHWCQSCADDHATACDYCSDHYETRALTRTGDGDDVCPHCIDEHYATCSDCGDLHAHDDTHTVDDCDTVCRHCIDSGNGDRYHYHEGHGWSTEPPKSDDDDDDHQGLSAGTMRRYGYHTDANDILNHTIPQTGHTYGAELEYKGNPSDWEAIASACRNRAILTNDSTVSGELVSAALTAGPIRRWLAATAAALAGSHNDTATGYHIHTDRRALSPWSWYTLAHYCAQHAATLEAIAGRPSNQWSNLQSLPAPDWPTFARSWKSRCWPTRYAGLNFYKGPTVEWRLCRATKTPARALARFGMVQRLMAIGRLKPSQRPGSEAELRGWLAQDRYIREITGWEPGAWNYRMALQQPEHQRDQPPAAPSVEQIMSLRVKLRRLEADHRLTEQLRYNARLQVSHPEPIYATDAMARFEHYRTEADRISREVRTARQDLDAAETLASLT